MRVRLEGSRANRGRLEGGKGGILRELVRVQTILRRPWREGREQDGGDGSCLVGTGSGTFKVLIAC